MVRMFFLSAILAIGMARPYHTFVLGVNDLDSLARQTSCPIDDICFAMDRSGSINSTEFEQEKNFIRAIASSIASKSGSNVRYSAYGFASSVTTIQRPTTSLSTFDATIASLFGTGGSTFMYGGLRACDRAVGSTSTNRVIVLVTDGVDNGSARASTLAPSIKAKGTKIITVGVGETVASKGSSGYTYLRNLATSRSLFITSRCFSEVISKVVRIVKLSCGILRCPASCCARCARR